MSLIDGPTTRQSERLKLHQASKSHGGEGTPHGENLPRKVAKLQKTKSQKESTHKTTSDTEPCTTKPNLLDTGKKGKADGNQSPQAAQVGQAAGGDLLDFLESKSEKANSAATTQAAEYLLALLSESEEAKEKPHSKIQYKDTGQVPGQVL